MEGRKGLWPWIALAVVAIIVCAVSGYQIGKQAALREKAAAMRAAEGAR